MTLEGTVINGAIVIDGNQPLPEGARVEVLLKPEPAVAEVVATGGKPVSALGAMLLRHAGKAIGLPEDMAAQHDHYLHGTPKR